LIPSPLLVICPHRGNPPKEPVGLVILDTTLPDPAGGVDSNLLSGTGQSRYLQFEAAAPAERVQPTNHFNPEAFHNHVADPAFGFFSGQRRRFTADFEILF
jgi:hypothetical protein